MRYPNLHLVSRIYRLIAYLILGVSGIGAAFFLLRGISYNFVSGFIMAFLTLLGGVILSISQLAIAEGIKAFIDLVENSHVQRKLTEDMVRHTLGTRPANKGTIVDPFS